MFQTVNAQKYDTLKWLLERKDVEGNELTNLPKYDLNEATLDGRTPLWQAAYKGYTEIAKMLVKHGANVLKLSSPSRNVHFSVSKLKPDDICLLLPHMLRVKVSKSLII